MKTTAFSANLDAVRAAAKARATELASAAVIQPPPAAILAPAQELKPAAKEPTRAPKLQQFNVRLSPEAKARLKECAKSCYLSDQDFLERLALSLPEPAPAPTSKMPWEQN